MDLNLFATRVAAAIATLNDDVVEAVLVIVFVAGVLVANPAISDVVKQIMVLYTATAIQQILQL